MGQICVAGFWVIIDFFTGMEGNAPIGGSFRWRFSRERW